MYVLNVDSAPGLKTFKCGKLLADWLMKDKHIPILALTKDGKKYVFADTELLREVLENKPFYILDIF